MIGIYSAGFVPGIANPHMQQIANLCYSVEQHADAAGQRCSVRILCRGLPIPTHNRLPICVTNPCVEQHADAADADAWQQDKSRYTCLEDAVKSVQ